MLELRARMRDGEEVIQMKCPNCETWGDVDKEQQEGLISCICPECNAHWIVQAEEVTE